MPSISSGNSQKSTTKNKTRTSQAHDPKPGAAVKKGSTQHSEPAASRGDRRQELIRQRREERLKYAEKHKRQQLITRIGLGALAVILIGAIGFGIYNWASDRSKNQPPDGTVTYDYTGTHDETIPLTYDQYPPAGGVHNPTPQNCGYYDQPIYDEHAVHSLEHGAVWITYQPDLPQDQIDVLKQTAEEMSYILVSPYPDQDSPIIMTSWDHQLKLDSVSDERFDKFIQVFRNSSKYTPEFGAACQGTSDVKSS
jgi:hypothetical protein